jgi:NAD(P)-dependent dehydrogenase (short-subunit alcohol dehydrogenase family)
MRAVVVGASTGLGRCIGIGLARRGAQVALLARRHELLADAAKEADGLAITCDVTDEAACQSAVDRAVGGLGGIDAVVYAAGIGVLSPIEKLDAASWRRSSPPMSSARPRVPQPRCPISGSRAGQWPT